MDVEDIGLNGQNLNELENVKQHYVKPGDDALTKFVKEFICQVQLAKNPTKAKIDMIYSKVRRSHHVHPNKADIRHMFEQKFADTPMSAIFNSWLVRKGGRTLSGVKVVTIVLSPHTFSCKYDCAMCPQEKNLKGEPTQPRSYLSSEPAMLRAIAHDFDIRGQFLNRINTYIYNGITRKTDIEKIEVILSGGTWESYPKEYREQVMLELYWSANTLFGGSREVKTLQEEQLENETGTFRIIGLTLETRPDNITKESIKDYLRWGVTRVQIGVQHFDDSVLRTINRKCYTSHTIQAIRLLKQAGFKVVVHLMPDLPGSSPEQDIWMFEQALTNPDVQFDDVKLYPTAVCKSSDPSLVVDSKLANWYKQGSYVPYAETSLDTLIHVLLYYKTRVQPWIRIQRLVRDIPSKSIESGYHKHSNLRQMIHDQMAKSGMVCNCIFCKEIGDRELENLTPRLVVRTYPASEGTEYHITIEAHTQNTEYYLYVLQSWLYWLFTGRTLYWEGNLNTYSALFGFLRLRLDPAPGGDFVPEINGCGLIREVHVYGTSLGVGNDAIGSQHRGYGQQLMRVAEDICLANGFVKTAVIAGVGSREYYKNKCGYFKGDTYMLKFLQQRHNMWWDFILVCLLSFIFLKIVPEHN